MNIILFTKYIGSPLTLRMGHSRFYMIAMSMILAVTAGIFYAGFWLGNTYATRGIDGGRAVAESNTVEGNNRRLLAIEQKNKNYISSLSQQIGQLKAQLMRLDDLGQRLTKIGKLDTSEFDFANPPALGGPNNTEATESIDIDKDIKLLKSHVYSREYKLGALEAHIIHQNLNKEMHPEGKPVEVGRMSSGFGMRTDPFSGRSTRHDGLDFASPEGNPIISVAGGVVTASERRAGYGNLVEVDHGNYITRYAHNKRNLVRAGQTVRKGQRIALVGSTGRSTGPHVHFEVIQDGKTVDPLPFVKAAER